MKGSMKPRGIKKITKRGVNADPKLALGEGGKETGRIEIVQ